MIDLPKSTIVGRFIPKEKFYTKTNISGKLRQLFTDEIEKITWANKIASDTLNITSKDYTEIQVFELALKGSAVSNAVLRHIDTFIPYPIIFILKSSSSQKAVISYKEPMAKNKHQMKVDSYYETPWQPEITLGLKGRSVDEIYKNFLFQIAPALKDTNNSDTKSAIATNKVNVAIRKQIDDINRQIANEPSIAKRQELARDRHILEKKQLIRLGKDK
jgi:hypothetical protein